MFFKSPLERGRDGASDSRGVFLRHVYQKQRHTPPPLSRGESRFPHFYKYYSLSALRSISLCSLPHFIISKMMPPKLRQYSVDSYSIKTGEVGVTVRLTSLFISMVFSSRDNIRVVMPGMLRSISLKRLFPLQMELMIGSVHLPPITYMVSCKACRSSA